MGSLKSRVQMYPGHIHLYIPGYLSLYCEFTNVEFLSQRVRVYFILTDLMTFPSIKFIPVYSTTDST